jgi:hypothetical protein
VSYVRCEPAAIDLAEESGSCDAGLGDSWLVRTGAVAAAA